MPVSSTNVGDQSEASSSTAPPATTQSSAASTNKSASAQGNAPQGNTYGKPSSSKHQKYKYNNFSPPPTNCVVLKNLDYNISQITLEEVVRRVAGGRKEFINVSLVDDKQTGTFRGMAFVNFHTTADATAALGELSKMVINGRKVIAEYRRLRPGEREKKEHYEKRNHRKFEHFSNHYRHTFERDANPESDEQGYAVDKRAAFFAKRDTGKKGDEPRHSDEKLEREKDREVEFRKRLLDYRDADAEDGEPIEDLVFESSLTAYERRMVHNICTNLGLGHISLTDDNGERVLHVTRDPTRKEEWDKETAKVKANIKKEEMQKRKNKENGDSRTPAEWKKGEANNKEDVQGIKWFKPRSAMGAPSDKNIDTLTGQGIRVPSYKLYVPPRQPTGPDGTIGFSSRCVKVPSSDEESEPHENGLHENGWVEEGSDVNEEASHKEASQINVEKRIDEKVVADGERSSAQKVLNPSVPAFSPSLTHTY